MKKIKIEPTNMPSEVRLIADGFSRSVMVQLPKDFAEYILEVFEIDQIAEKSLNKITQAERSEKE